ncbi:MULTISPECIES: aldehyde dehydrogenase family protein [unclassified Bacillus (in: firmicutes)]|uniref:aldehyde dehydrogenase family protein n=1 Tax=unclassified Bacillus (in: firmicutes) TaxID=185979 RepID=UPI0030004CCA
MSQRLLPNLKLSEQFLKGIKYLFIDGEFVPSVSGKTFDTVNPATEEVIATVCAAQEEDIELAVKAARKAFETGPWPKLSGSERANLLLKLADLIEENKEVLAQLESLDNGKPYIRALEDDIPGVVDYFRYYAGWATKFYGQTIPYSPEYVTYTRHEPIGVVGAIAPWNFPLMLVAWKLGAALATGCTVVLKPAEQTPLTALYFAELVKRAGFPDGVVNIVPGFGNIAGEAILNHKDIDKISFTGSTVTGKHIMKRASETVKDITLELGGKSPNIIMEDANLTKAIPGVFNGIMYNHGQNCSAGSRIYVHRKHYEDVVNQLASLAKQVKLGDGLDPETEMGPLVSKQQQERVLNYIEIGKAEGAQIVAGGGKGLEKGYFVEPTIIVNVTEEMTIVKEEIFGPVAVVLPFDTIDEVVERANNSDYGLAAGIWTENVKTAHIVSNKLAVGTVWVNCYGLEPAETPFGGYKQSGIGRDNGSYALENFTKVKTIWISLED